MHLQICRHEHISDTSIQVEQQSASSTANSAGEFELAQLNKRIDALMRENNDLRSKMKEVEEDNLGLRYENRSLREDLQEARMNTLNCESRRLDQVLISSRTLNTESMRLDEAVAGALSDVQTRAEEVQEVMKAQIQDLDVEHARKKEQLVQASRLLRKLDIA